MKEELSTTDEDEVSASDFFQNGRGWEKGRGNGLMDGRVAEWVAVYRLRSTDVQTLLHIL